LNNIFDIIPKVDDSYISRSINGMSEFEIYNKSINLKKNILLIGPTGSGKTSSIKNFAAVSKMDLYTFPCNQSVETYQMFGIKTLDKDNKLIWQDSPMTKIIRNGGVLNFSDIAFLNDNISESIFSLLDDRRYIVLLDNDGEIVKAHDNLIIFADMNEEDSGGFSLIKPLLDRFDIKIFFDYDEKIENSLIKSKTLLNMAKNIRSSTIDKKFNTDLSTRSLLNFEIMVENFNLNFAIESFINSFSYFEREGVRFAIEALKDLLQKDYAL
jgi:MoxR-like ATPase